MTCNQLITALEIYRTGDISKIRCGTTDMDIQILHSKGWLQLPHSGNLELTPLGRRKIAALLEVL